jgi:hypothetical protein
MIKIIKPGTLSIPAGDLYTGTCARCGTIVECHEQNVTKIENFNLLFCPTPYCGVNIYMTKKDSVYNPVENK